MVGGKSFIFAFVINLILFLSMIPVISSLKGDFALFELILLIIFLIVAIILTSKCSKKVWPSFYIFYAVNLINELFIYFKTFKLSPLLLPFMVTFLGFLIAIIKLSASKEDLGIETYETKEEPVKKTIKKSTAKKAKPKKKSSKLSSKSEKGLKKSKTFSKKKSAKRKR